MLLQRAFPDHGHRGPMVDVVLILVYCDPHVIPGLKIANLCGSAGNTEVFSRFRGRDGGDRLVLGLNDEVVIPDASQHPDERCRSLLRLAIRRLTSWAALRIASARISATRISATGISDAGNDLAKTGNAGQQENYR